MFKEKLRAFGVVLGCVGWLAGSSTQAQLIFYTNQVSFLSSINPGYYKETFESVNVSALPLSVDLSSSGFSYQMSSPANNPGEGLYPGGTASDKWVSTYWPQYGLVFTNFSANVSAVGGYFFPTDFNGAWTNTPISVTLTTVGGDGVRPAAYSTNYTTIGPSSYLGLKVSTGQSIASLRIVNATNAPTQEFMTVNDFTVGVPEPSSLAALAVGGAVLLALRRARKA